MKIANAGSVPAIRQLPALLSTLRRAGIVPVAPAPLRLEFAGALYHVTSRGDHREAIYRDELDREAWLTILGLVCKRFNFIVHAYCQMTNHYHLMVETVDGNLSQGMRQLNGLFVQAFNRRHRLAGHLFQGRYKAILVQREQYLMALTRYIVLNPARAGIVNSADQWRWSSHHCYVAHYTAPAWLDTEWTLKQFDCNRQTAVGAYASSVQPSGIVIFFGRENGKGTAMISNMPVNRCHFI